MKCPFNCGSKNDNPNFDNVAEHVVMVADVKGKMHIHGPFDSEFVIRRFADAFIAEMEKHGMKYIPATKDRIGD